MKQLAACLLVAGMLAGCGPDQEKCDALGVKMVDGGLDALNYQAMAAEAMMDFDSEAAKGYLDKAEKAMERAQKADDEYVALGCKDAN